MQKQWTPLHYACRNRGEGDDEIATLLLDWGADVNAVSEVIGSEGLREK